MTVNSFIFCLSGKLFTSPSTTLPGGVFLIGSCFFFFQHFEYTVSLPSSLQSFCWKICWWSYGGCLVHNITSYLSLAAWILFLSLTFDSLIITCGNCPGFLDLDVCFLPQVKKSFLLSLSLSLLGPYIRNICLLDGVQ